MTLLVATVKLVAAVVHNVLLDGCKAMTGTGITVNVAMSLVVVQEPELRRHYYVRYATGHIANDVVHLDHRW